MSDAPGINTAATAEGFRHNDHGDLELRPNEIAVGVIVGRIGEAFDFFVYGIASVLVFPALFFPFVSTYDGIFYCFVIFSLGFVARAAGAFVFRVIHVRYGRPAKLTSALFLLGTSTVCIAFLPGYAEIGVTAIALLAALRVTQGLAVGGAWDGLPSLLAVTAPPGKRGWYAMISQLGAPIGFIVATALFAYLAAGIAADEFIDWGWRFAFFTAFAINVVTLFARLRMVVTPEYDELLHARELNPSPLGELFRDRGKDILLGALVPLAAYALFHLVTIFPLTWVILFPEQFAPGDLFELQIIGAFLCLGSMLISGRVADRIGRPRTMWWGSVLIVLFCLPAPFLGDTEFGARAFVPVGFALLGFSLAQSAGAVNDCFESRYRYTGALLTNELGWLLGAGFAPLVALVLADYLGNGGVALYLSSGAVASLIALRVYLKRFASNA
ncbi:MAG: MFS transporter [Pseudomonadota bacterium]